MRTFFFLNDPDDVFFFNWNWAGECRGRWAGPGWLADWDAGYWIVGAGVGRCCCWSAGSGCDTPLQEEPARRRAGEGFARGRSDT